MRNLLRRCSLLVAATLLATALLSSGFSAEPAGAGTISRRTSRPYRYRTSRSAFRTPRFVTGDVWARLRQCESGGRYDVNSGNGFYGAYQFHPRTWRTLGYGGLPHQAPPEVQDEAARKLQARSGWGQWPVCSRRIGAR
jgi:Transglycosylase-like domain